ncbi:MAG: DUF1343 domain-containing protein, partial [Myxococcales bacterium]|nr:DUF1343 domain-containing protein [Myxococcales bacterium]
GMCLLEATNISEARGTTKPFEFFGAPFVDPTALADELNGLNLPGVIFRPVAFKPGFQKWANQQCFGSQVHLTDRNALNAYNLGLAVVTTLFRLYPGQTAWRDKPYEFIEDVPAIDLLCGNPRVRPLVEQGGDLERIWAVASQGSEAFEARRALVSLYPTERQG